MNFISEVKMKTTTCCACGVSFAMPDTLMEDLRNTGRDFFCPNGHNLFFDKGRNDRLRDQVGQLEQQLIWERGRTKAAKNEARAAKAAHTRLKNKVKMEEEEVGGSDEQRPDHAGSGKRES